jgi:hypothetical protein
MQLGKRKYILEILGSSSVSKKENPIFMNSKVSETKKGM